LVFFDVLSLACYCVTAVFLFGFVFCLAALVFFRYFILSYVPGTMLFFLRDKRRKLFFIDS
ncbi:MAG: hypothetical protein ACOX7J_06370, partial [Bacillota bacterium]|jgi:hypothetical protein